MKVWFRSLGVLLAVLLVFGTLTSLLISPSDELRTLAAGLLVVALLTGLLVAWVCLPDVDWPGRTLRRGPKHRPLVALTFDDGPNGDHTRAILDVLARHGAKATFFCVGRFAEAQPELIRRMVAEGHVVANHTRSHALLPRLSVAALTCEVEESQRQLCEAGAPMPTLFRAPKGFKHPALPKVLRDNGLALVGWTVGVWDTDRPSAEVIATRARKRLKNGAILLFHDGLLGTDRSRTAEALERVLADCAARGLRPVTIPELMSAR